MFSGCTTLAGTVTAIFPEWSTFRIVGGKATIEMLHRQPADHGQQKNGTGCYQLDNHQAPSPAKPINTRDRIPPIIKVIVAP